MCPGVVGPVVVAGVRRGSDSFHRSSEIEGLRLRLFSRQSAVFSACVHVSKNSIQSCSALLSPSSPSLSSSFLGGAAVASSSVAAATIDVDAQAVDLGLGRPRLALVNDLDPVAVRVFHEGEPFHSAAVGALLELHALALEPLARRVDVRKGLER